MLFISEASLNLSSATANMKKNWVYKYTDIELNQTARP